MLGGLILLTWLGALATLGAQTEGAAGAQAQALQVDRPPGMRQGDEWQTLYMKGERVGYVHLNKRREEAGWRVRYELELSLKVMKSDQLIRTELDGRLDELLTLKEFDFELDGGIGTNLGVHGKVEGKDVVLTIKTGGATTTQSLSLPERPRLSLTNRTLVAAQGLAVGKSFETSFFDPSTLSQRTTRVEVIGEEKLHVLGKSVDAFVLRQSLEGLTLHAWVTAAGDVLKEELPLGLVAVRETEEEARFGMGLKHGGLSSSVVPEASTGSTDIIGATSAQLIGTFPADPATLSRAVFELDDLPPGKFELSEGRQRLSGRRLTVVKEQVPPTSAPIADAGPEVAQAVAAEPLIQSDHPNIVKKAREIVGDTQDGVRRVRMIMAWLAENMEQVNVVGVPSALETLQTLRGDCNEHTTLFAALARAVGLPTRVDVGMVHQQGRFFYHAWAEVMLDGNWVTVDPTWGQLPADVTHLRFVRGSLREQLAMFNVIGRIKEVTLVEAAQ